MRGSNALNTRKMLNAVVLSQYVLRITRIYLSWRKSKEEQYHPPIDDHSSESWIQFVPVYCCQSCK